MIEGFLLGVIVTCSFIAAGYFLKFWLATRDWLFAGFAAAFFLEGFNRSSVLFMQSPNFADQSFYVIRLVSYLLILGAIAYKNRA